MKTEQTQSTGPGTVGFRRKYGEDPYPQSQNDKSFIAGDGTKGCRVWMHKDAVAEIKRLGILLDEARSAYLNMRQFAESNGLNTATVNPPNDAALRQPRQRP